MCRDNLEGMALSLCDFESVRRFVEDFKAMNLPLHLLINSILLCDEVHRSVGWVDKEAREEVL